MLTGCISQSFGETLHLKAEPETYPVVRSQYLHEDPEVANLEAITQIEKLIFTYINLCSTMIAYDKPMFIWGSLATPFFLGCRPPSSNVWSRLQPGGTAVALEFLFFFFFFFFEFLGFCFCFLILIQFCFLNFWAIVELMPK